MARNTHVSGHPDKLTGLVRQIARLASEVSRIRSMLMRDALLAPGYRLEHRPEADPPGLYIVNKSKENEHGEAEAEEAARFLCP